MGSIDWCSRAVFSFATGLYLFGETVVGHVRMTGTVSGSDGALLPVSRQLTDTELDELESLVQAIEVPRRRDPPEGDDYCWTWSLEVDGDVLGTYDVEGPSGQATAAQVLAVIDYLDAAYPWRPASTIPAVKVPSVELPLVEAFWWRSAVKKPHEIISREKERAHA